MGEFYDALYKVPLGVVVTALILGMLVLYLVYLPTLKKECQ